VPHSLSLGSAGATGWCEDVQVGRISAHALLALAGQRGLLSLTLAAPGW